ncbi:ATP synthase F0 subunit B [Edaphobacter modestus]|uniref:ATP synthase subunit b n=1 Tax=Edaphobacter modestus TaxID=388466 RepID=A0A4Q7YRP5_9BACT|nr:ATP synthase F0 subunit B [Edaphobacter modestus]RZU40472.1 F-type H+-transporting ATPase subunit b [Edaphobacter modestus]
MKGFRIASRGLLPGLALAFLLLGAAPRLRAVESAPVVAQEGGEATPGTQQTEHKEEQSDEEAFRHSASVKSLGAKFGLDPEQAATVFTVANFVVLALLVGWFLMKTLPKTFRNRNSALQKHLVEARAASEEANSRLGSVEARLAKLDEQIEAMRTQAEKDAQKDEQRMKASVEEEKQKILASAEQEIAAATTQARRQIQQYAADLAVNQAAKKLVVTAETDRALVQEFARRLGADFEGGRN